ncbi:2-oxo acid dehydrogenase subunit E2 [Mucilaginibacter sp. ZT4R22]|uniref:Dihydrolipoamide acetyltransferase component of pyruvate dehydrogenase complex n=1 Tax=Mucilaginibacter pankratovii TaxID=2772110 RepID=A0ABR7WUI3_9SPHI|nr:dihydrolipoamide acetyltransferase family protein [Mucilaginibacter pankratovii]MBD1365955.1 2-oxo acid dehydrogenase subunit E2 [Mucilaginibacter pankratovii]
MAKYQLLLPKMGESVAEATVIKWTKGLGDHIEIDEAVMEIATDKVDSEVPSPVAGKLIEQLYKEDDVVQVGAVIAVIETEPDKAEEPAPTPAPVAETIPQPVAYTAPVAPPIPQPTSENVAPPAPQNVAPAPPVAAAPAQEIPGISQLEQRPAITVSNVKFDNRFYSPLVKSIAIQEGIGNDELDHIPGTGADGRLTKDDLLDYIQHRPAKATAAPAQPVAPPKPVAEPEIHRDPVITYTAAIPPPYTPPPAPVEQLAPAVAEEPAVESATSSAQPETPKTEAPKPAAKPAASVSGGDEIIEMDRMRRLIADHMVYSKHTSPHVTSFVEADVTELVNWREKVKGPFEKREGQKLTFTPIFIEAVIKAIIALPMINVSVVGTQIIKKKNINISMATALPNGNLIVPVIKRADELSLLGIAKAVNDLAHRARIGKLLPDDVKDGTFTITNVGSFGNVMGTPIINQPQVAILAVGTIKKKPAVVETPQGDAIAIRHMMFLSLSYDHRVVDGALGGTFVRKVADYLENWDISRNI